MEDEADVRKKADKVWARKEKMLEAVDETVAAD